MGKVITTTHRILVKAILLCFIFASCNYKKASPVCNVGFLKSPIDQTSDNEQRLYTDTFTTKTGKILTVKQLCLPNHRCDITITTHGLCKDSIINISRSWPIKKILLRDIDNNGYDEMYIFTQNLVQEISLLAYSTNFDRQFTAMEIPLFKREGTYKGMDSFYFNRTQLMRAYPVPCGIEKKSGTIFYRQFTEIYTLHKNSIMPLGKDLNRL